MHITTICIWDMVPLEDIVTFVCIQLKHVVSELIKHKLQYIMLFNLTICLSQRQVNVTLSCNWVILYMDCKVYLNYTNFYLCVRVCMSAVCVYVYVYLCTYICVLFTSKASNIHCNNKLYRCNIHLEMLITNR